MGITVKQIAEKAGVSWSAVAAVIKDDYTHSRVSEEKKKKIRSLLDKYHYIPNATAQSLVTRRTHIFNIIIPSATFFQTHHYSTIITGLQRYADTVGYRLKFTSLAEGYRDYKSLNGIIADGIILFYWGENHNKVVNEVRKMHLPLLVVYGRCNLPKVYNLYFDNKTCMYNLAKKLIKMGHKHIAYAPSYTGDTFHKDGLAGLQKAVEEHPGIKLKTFRLSADLNHPKYDKALFESGQQGFKNIMTGPDKPSVIIFNHDSAAFGGIARARTMGLSIPQDVAIASSGNHPFAELLEPALTSVDLRPDDFGKQLGEMLMTLIGKKKLKEYKMKFLPEAIYRASTVGY